MTGSFAALGRIMGFVAAANVLGIALGLGYKNDQCFIRISMLRLGY
jgi:hypothetical protein